MQTPTKVWIPRPGRFAVVQIDPECTLKHYVDDPVAMAELEALNLTPKKYLVRLERPTRIPLPWVSYHGYGVEPIAPTLRREEPQRHITSDMCLPIFPNTTHPTGRAPLQVEGGAFPFSNCYQWYKYALSVNVKPNPDGFEHNGALYLTEESAADVLRSTYTDSEHIAVIEDEIHIGRHSDDEVCSECGDPDDFPDRPLEPPELRPFVNMWLELSEHLTEDTIPDPDELFKERDALQSIYNRHIERNGGIEAYMEHAIAQERLQESQAFERALEDNRIRSHDKKEGAEDGKLETRMGAAPPVSRKRRLSLSDVRRRINGFLVDVALAVHDTFACCCPLR